MITSLPIIKLVYTYAALALVKLLRRLTQWSIVKLKRRQQHLGSIGITCVSITISLLLSVQCVYYSMSCPPRHLEPNWDCWKTDAAVAGLSASLSCCQVSSVKCPCRRAGRSDPEARTFVDLLCMHAPGWYIGHLDQFFIRPCLVSKIFTFLVTSNLAAYT